jgi:hypothetical protein
VALFNERKAMTTLRAGDIEPDLFVAGLHHRLATRTRKSNFCHLAKPEKKSEAQVSLKFSYSAN